MNRPITRDDINQIVMEISEQDCLGALSNIHLAYVDKQGIKSKICTDLAGAISQEVDAAKTGKHPLSDKQIAEHRKGLKNEWPDFMKARGKKLFYPSERVLGKYLLFLDPILMMFFVMQFISKDQLCIF